MCIKIRIKQTPSYDAGVSSGSIYIISFEGTVGNILSRMNPGHVLASFLNIRCDTRSITSTSPL